MRLILTVILSILLLPILTEAYKQRRHHKLNLRHFGGHQRRHGSAAAAGVKKVHENDKVTTGYIFTGEQSVCSCRENIVYLEFLKYFADNYAPGDCGVWSFRQFGDKTFNDTNLYTGYSDYDRLMFYIVPWIKDDQNNNCKYGDNASYQATLLNALSLIQNGGRPKVAMFIQGETDTIVDLEVSLSLARRIAAYNPRLYVWDHSRNGDQTGLFSILTRNQPGHIIRSNASLIDLINIAKQQMIPEFASIGCGMPNVSIPLPSEPVLPPSPGNCASITPIYHLTTQPFTSPMPPTTTTTTSTRTTSTTTTRASSSTIRVTTTQQPITTTRPSPTITYPPTNKTCYGIAFAGEMTKAISCTKKRAFYESVLLIAAQLPIDDLQFGITTYGINIYQPLGFQSYHDFIVTVNQLISKLCDPGGSVPYAQKPLNAIYYSVLDHPTQKITVFFMGEMESMQDPNAAKTASQKIVSTGTNAYVLDNSKGTISQSIWLYLTNNHQERIVNGTGKSSKDILNAFKGTLIKDINSGHC